MCCAVSLGFERRTEFFETGQARRKKKNIFSFSSKTGKLEESCKVLVYISIKGAKGKYKFLGEANTCL